MSANREIGASRLAAGAACLASAGLVVLLAHGEIGRALSTLRSALPSERAAALPFAPAAAAPVRLAAGGALHLVQARSRNLDRIATAVGGAESDNGANPAMWRADPQGPQGPMQVSAAAAADVGGGDRFDVGENLALGRAYLARMYRRYGSWADAIAAYNWGPGRLDAWIRSGRPASRLPVEVERYTGRVLLASAAPGLRLAAPDLRALSFAPRPLGIVHPQPGRAAAPGLLRAGRRVALRLGGPLTWSRRRPARPAPVNPNDPVQQLYGQLMQQSGQSR